MKISVYTNAVLTVIAIALLYLCVLETRRPVTAHAAQYTVPLVQGRCDSCSDATYQNAVPVVVLGWSKPGGLVQLTPKP